MLIIDLIYNLSALVAISVLSGFVNQQSQRHKFAGSILQGLLFGAAALAGMLHPVVLEKGLIFDGRSIVISTATLFFGPISGIITLFPVVFYRLILGGPGVNMGLAVGMSSFLTGWYFHYKYVQKGKGLPGNFAIYSMGLVVHAAMIFSMYLLPGANQLEVLVVTGPTILIIYPVINLLMGKILTLQESNIQMLHKIKEDEQHFRATFYSIGDAIITTDAEGRIQRINVEAERLTGLKAGEMEGHQIADIILLLDEHSGHKVEHPVMQVLSGESAGGNFSYLMKQKNGDAIPVSDAVSAIRDKQKQLLGAVFIFRDRRPEIRRNNELLKSAESYRNLFNNIGSAAYVQDRAGRFIDVNEGAVKLYGYPKEYFIGKTPEILSAPGRNDMEALKEHIAAAFEGDARMFEFWGRKADGSVFPKEVHLFKTTYGSEEAVFAIGYDVSLRHKAESELREIRERYQTLFDASPVGIILEDLDGMILDVNTTVCLDYGYSREEMIGAHINLIVEASRRNQVATNIETIRQKKVLVSRVKGICSNGEFKYFELIETLIALPDGRSGILSISKNISPQVEAEEARQRIENRNKAILSAIPDLFFRFTSAGKIIDSMAPDSSLLIAPPEEFIGKNLDSFLPAGLLPLTMEFITKTIALDQLHTFEYQLDIPPSGTQWYEARMVKSGPDEVLTIIRNITGRKMDEFEINRQKEFIETLLESIPNPMFYMNRDGEFLGVNKSFRELYNMEESEIVGKNIYDIESAINASRYKESDELIFRGEEKFQSLERTITLKNDRKIEVILTKSPFPGDGGKIGGLIGMITDITEQKKLQRELKRAKEQAEESDKLKTSFLNNMNHEIRTPLNAIVGFSDLLFEDYSEEEKRSFVLTINNNAEQLLRIIDDVLVISRLDAEHLPLELETTDVNALLADLHRSFNINCTQKGLNLIIDESWSQHPLHLLIDKGKLRQVMSGLLENAIKYTMRGNIRFGYQLMTGRIRFFVKDTGIGIPVAEQSMVFDRFYRSIEAQSRALRGNGLGLSISKGLVEIMGGEMGLESTPEVGSNFYFEVPADVLHINVPNENAIRHSDPFKQYSLLLVDDEADNLELLYAILGRRFKKTITAKSGYEALQLMDEFVFDLVLMDIKMPALNGIETTKQILEKYPQTMIIGQTAYSQPDDQQLIVEAGALGCITKPIEQEALLKVLAAEIEKAKAGNQPA